jgi:Flp pilus assembly pilin Flp
MRWRTRRNGRNEQGASAVEFALVVIPLLLVVGGIINFGVAFANQISLDNAVRQAARATVVDSGRGLVPATIVANEYRPITPDADPTVTLPLRTSCEGTELGDSLQVRAEVTTEFLFPWPLPDAVLPGQIELNSQAEFQCEYS